MFLRWLLAWHTNLWIQLSLEDICQSKCVFSPTLAMCKFGFACTCWQWSHREIALAKFRSDVSCQTWKILFCFLVEGPYKNYCSTGWDMRRRWQLFLSMIFKHFLAIFRFNTFCKNSKNITADNAENRK